MKSIFDLSLEEERVAREIDEGHKAIIEQLEINFCDEHETPEETSKDKVRLLKAMLARDQELESYYQGVIDDHFRQLGDDPDILEQSARFEIDSYITRHYAQYERIRTTGKSPSGTDVKAFRNDDMRATENGGFLLDTNKVIETLLSSVVSRHLEALKRRRKRTQIIELYAAQAALESPLTSDTEGVLFGEVQTIPKTEQLPQERAPQEQENTEKIYIVTRPEKYVTSVDLVIRDAFGNQLTKPPEIPRDHLTPVILGRKSPTRARAALIYDDLIEKGIILEAPKLTPKDWGVYDALISNLEQGNHVMTMDMIYRAMTGKVEPEKVHVSPETAAQINESLDKFRGILHLRYEQVEKQRNGQERVAIIKEWDEPLVSFARENDLNINGSIVEMSITLSSDPKLYPPLYKWSQFNKNQLDRQDIRLLDVPGLNNGDESYTVKMLLYRRIVDMIGMQRNKRLKSYKKIIRYDYIYDGLGLTDPDKRKRSLVKTKIDTCLSYWKSKGFIAGYQHMRDKANGNQFYGVNISLIKSK